MKNRGKKLIAALSVLTTAAVAIHMINRLISRSAESENLLSRRQGNTFSWRFGNVNYTKTGKGTPVLLLHELSCCSSTYEWHRIVQTLSGSHTVYCIDLPGCGLSERQNVTSTNFYYVQLLTDFTKSVIGCKTDLVATGLSASIAVTACNYNPDAYGKLILVNPCSLQQLAQIPTRKSKAAKALIEFPILGTMLYHMIMSRRQIEEEFDQRLFSHPALVSDAYIDVYHECAHRDGSEGKYLFSSLIGNYLYFNISHALKTINNDIVIIGGASQPDIQETIEMYQAVNPAIESVILPDTKHLPQLECPSEFLDQLAVYLDPVESYE